MWGFYKLFILQCDFRLLYDLFKKKETQFGKELNAPGVLKSASSEIC